MFDLDTIRNFAVFVLIVGGLIFIHELGHFLAAIKLGVKVKEFGIGFPPRLVGTARDNTGRRRWFFGKAPADLDPNSVIYSLNWFPLGGFVRPAGEDDPTVPDGLAASPKLTRLIVLFAGPAANLIAGVLVFAIMFATGYPEATGRILIADVVPGSPADAAGIRSGDFVLSANAETISGTTERLIKIIHDNVGRSVDLVIDREGKSFEVTLVPRLPEDTPENQGPLGISLGYETHIATQPWYQALVSSVKQVGVQIEETFMMPARVIAGTIKASDVRFVSIVGIAQINDVVVDTAYEVQALFPILQFTGVITVALALTNLLPLPALDGGRILFVLIEAVRGRRVDPLREGYVHVMGLLVLLALMVVMVINDILNPIVPR